MAVGLISLPLLSFPFPCPPIRKRFSVRIPFRTRPFVSEPFLNLYQPQEETEKNKTEKNPIFHFQLGKEGVNSHYPFLTPHALCLNPGFVGGGVFRTSLVMGRAVIETGDRNGRPMADPACHSGLKKDTWALVATPKAKEKGPDPGRNEQKEHTLSAPKLSRVWVWGVCMYSYELDKRVRRFLPIRRC